eukprot:5553034-Prymnesium_polylepis.2
MSRAREESEAVANKSPARTTKVRRPQTTRSLRTSTRRWPRTRPFQRGRHSPPRRPDGRATTGGGREGHARRLRAD